MLIKLGLKALLATVKREAKQSDVIRLAHESFIGF